MVKLLTFSIFIVLFSLTVAAQGPVPQLWYWQYSFLNSSQALQSTEALIDRAAAAGYTGVAFWDVNSQFLSSSFWPSNHTSYFQQALHYARSKGLQVMVTAAPYGYSNNVLENNTSWAEAQRVVGTQFEVNSTRTQLKLINSFPGLVNSGFESGKTGWFDLNDAGVSRSTTVSHTGEASAEIANAPANGRIRQGFVLKPWRQYHLRLFYKSHNFGGYAQFALVDAGNFNAVRITDAIRAGGTQAWTEVDYTFNSQSSTEGYLYLGVYGGSSGLLWLDDIQIEETAFVYAVRGRAGTPLTVYNPKKPAQVFKEGTDYDYIEDPRMTSTRTPFTDNYHAPDPVTLPSRTSLTAGEIVAIDSYSAFPIPGDFSMDMCLTDSGVLEWLSQNAKAIAAVLPEGGGLFLSYDEMHQMNSCLTCRSKNLTAGQLLARGVRDSISIYQEAMPNSKLYVWSDMFDPYHNAVSNYFYVEDNISGSWNGLPADVIIMNWNLDNLTNSLKWFSGTNTSQKITHEQIIAGYYDSGNGATSAAQELSQAAGVPGIVGLMYTSWGADYSQLESFAAAARRSWPTYVASVPGSVLIHPPTLPGPLPIGHARVE